MKNDNLTAYDRFVISKKNDVEERYEIKQTYSVKEKDESVKFSASYVQYLQDQLNRTEPSEEKVLTEEEFNNRSTRKNRFWSSLKEDNASSESDTAVKAIRFKKFGKYLLIGYVIIMLCLALIVIVKTTTVDNTTTADASADEIESSSDIERMQDEKGGENNDWFDKFCDSLK